MTWYSFFKFVHVLAVVIWVGGATFVQALSLRVLASTDPRRKAEFAGDAEVVGMRLFVPASLVVLLAGIAMMVNAHFDWGQLWIVFALVVYGFSFATGAGFLGPESGRIKQAIETHGADAPIVTERIRRILVVSRIELVLLFGIVFAMVVKPTTGDAGTVAGAAAVMAVLIALNVLDYRRRPKVPDAARATAVS